MDEVTLIEKNILAGWNTQAIKTCFIVNNITMKDCIKSNSPECVKWLLNNGYDVHTEDDSALCWASRYCHLEVVKLLLEAGANIHAIDDKTMDEVTFQDN